MSVASKDHSLWFLDINSYAKCWTSEDHEGKFLTSDQISDLLVNIQVQLLSGHRQFVFL